MTLLKRNLCTPDGEVFLEDIEPTTILPLECRIPLTIDINEHGVLTGVGWVEEHHTTKLPWLLTLLFFWLITPKVTKKIVVHLEQEKLNVDFNFEFDSSKTVHENLCQAPESLGIKQVWIGLDTVENT